MILKVNKLAARIVAAAGLAAASAAPAQTGAPGEVKVYTTPQGQTVIVTPPGRTPPDGGGTDTPSTGGDFAMEWNSVDGGGIMYFTGGLFDVGATFGQPDAGSMSGDCFSLIGGFWAITAQADCYANCDESTTPPVLNVADFTCFLQKYAAGCP